MNSRSQHSNSETIEFESIHVHVNVYVLLSVVESKEGYPLGPISKWNIFGFLFVAPAKFLFVPDLGICVGCIDFIQILA